MSFMVTNNKCANQAVIIPQELELVFRQMITKKKIYFYFKIVRKILPMQNSIIFK